MMATCNHGQHLLYLPHRLIDFRDAEIVAVANMLGASASGLNLRCLPGDSVFSPLRMIDSVCEEVACEMIKRTVLAKGAFELWGLGGSIAEVQESLKGCPEHIKSKWMSHDMTYKWIVDGFGNRISEVKQKEVMRELSTVCPFQGQVKLTSPDLKMWVIIVNMDEASGMPTEVPYRIVVARELGSQLQYARSRLNVFALKFRRFIGPTSMDHELACLMCNHGHVQQGSLVLDPFAGTGSILIAAALHGARVVGGDIDIRLLRDGKKDPKGKHCNVYTNFQDYGLDDPLGLLRCDGANPPWRPGLEGVIDAILCDPPYGVRAGARKISRCVAGSLDKREPYIPATSPYGLGECLWDLLDTAAKLLACGGRLVYWMPDFNDAGAGLTSVNSPLTNYVSRITLDQAPLVGSVFRDPLQASCGHKISQHPCLVVESNSVQILSSRHVRRLITMVKTREYSSDAVQKFRDQVGHPSMAIDELHDLVYLPREQSGNFIRKQHYRSKQV